MALPSDRIMTEEEANKVSMQASRVFQPRAAISTPELFSGRWDQITAVVDAVSQTGLHVVIYGERGVGKTSLARILRPLLHVYDQDACDPPRLVTTVNGQAGDSFASAWYRAFDETFVPVETPTFGFGKGEADATKRPVPLSKAMGLSREPSVDDVRRILSQLPGSLFVFDEFDRIDRDSSKGFTDLIKALSDFAVETTVVLVGVSETVDELVADHASIARAMIQVPMPRMQPNELRAILTKGEDQLKMTFDEDAATLVVTLSQGLPHYTHLVGQHAVRTACQRLSTRVETADVNEALNRAVQHAQQSIISKFSEATRSAHKDALYAKVLLACAITASRTIDDLGYFQPAGVATPLSVVLGRKVEIPTFNKHLAEFCEDKRGAVLDRTGPKRGYRYRFRDPLMPPYVIMEGLASGLINDATMSSPLVAPDPGTSTHDK